MSVEDTVQLNIALDQASVGEQGFDPMIMGHSDNSDLTDHEVRTYENAADMLDDGFLATDYEYLAVNGMFSQTPRPAQSLVAKLSDFVAQLSNVLITGNNDGTYRVTINGVDFDFVATGNSVTQIVQGLVAAIDGGTEPVDAQNLDPSVGILADEAGVPFTISVESIGGASPMTLTTTTPNNGYTENIAAIRENDDDWWGLGIEDKTEGLILDCAAAVEPIHKQLFAQTNDAGCLDPLVTDDVMSQVKDNAYFGTNVWYYADDAEVLAESLMGKFLGTDPDSGITIAGHKTLAGVTVSDLTTSQQNALQDKRGNFYVSLAGTGSTWKGSTGDGKWVDNALTVDWLYFRLREDCIREFLKASNRGSLIPYTNPGIATFRAVTRDRLQIGQNIGHFDPDVEPTITMPDRADVTPADVSNRRLRWSFAVQFANAIQEAIISGAVVDELTT